MFTSWSLEEAPRSDDRGEGQSEGEVALMLNELLLYLVGTQLEFTDGLNGKGFVFNNPNASRTCGCGESFAV